MITGWLVKLVLGVAVAGFLVVELATPVIVRVQLDGTAHEIADEAGVILRDRSDEAAAEQVAAQGAALHDAELVSFEVDEEGKAKITLRKQAKSYLLEKVEQFESWYDVRVTATSEGGR